MKGYSLAIVLSAIATSLPVAQSVWAERPLAGTNWTSDAKQLSDGYYSMCHINRIEFWEDGTAEMTFDDQGDMDMDDGTWALSGDNLTISYVGRFDPKFYERFADEKLGGTYANGKVELAHSWKDRDGNPQSETCTFTIEPAKRQPNPHRRSRHKA